MVMKVVAEELDLRNRFRLRFRIIEMAGEEDCKREFAK
jgi:hypothetical protein